MNCSPHDNPAADAEALLLRQANADARALLREVLQALRPVLRDEFLMEETPFEVWMPMESAVETIGAALGRLEATNPSKGSQIDPTAEGPTHRQGQFLAYICEYMRQNSAGLAPTHAAMQRFFGLTAPSVNSMLIRLEQRGFIRRTPRVARGIEISIDSALIPPLEQPFKF
jgi:hypothetical protein